MYGGMPGVSTAALHASLHGLVAWAVRAHAFYRRWSPDFLVAALVLGALLWVVAWATSMRGLVRCGLYLWMVSVIGWVATGLMLSMAAGR